MADPPAGIMSEIVYILWIIAALLAILIYVISILPENRLPFLNKTIIPLAIFTILSLNFWLIVDVVIMAWHAISDFISDFYSRFENAKYGDAEVEIFALVTVFGGFLVACIVLGLLHGFFEARGVRSEHFWVVVGTVIVASFVTLGLIGEHVPLVWFPIAYLGVVAAGALVWWDITSTHKRR